MIREAALGNGLQSSSGTEYQSMTEHISDSDLERIAQFVDTPAYEREPEQLLPEDVDND